MNKKRMFFSGLFLTAAVSIGLYYSGNSPLKIAPRLTGVKESVESNRKPSSAISPEVALLKLRSNSETTTAGEPVLPQTQKIKAMLALLIKLKPEFEIDDAYLAELEAALGQDSVGELALEMILQNLALYLGAKPEDIPLVSCRDRNDCPKDFYPVFKDSMSRLDTAKFSHMKHLLQDQIMASDLSSEEKYSIFERELTDTRSSYIESKSEYTPEGQVNLGADALYALATQERLVANAKSFDEAKEVTFRAIELTPSHINKLALGVNLIMKDRSQSEEIVSRLAESGISDEEILHFLIGPVPQ